MSPELSSLTGRRGRGHAIAAGPLLLDGLRTVVEGEPVSTRLQAAARSHAAGPALVEGALQHAVASVLHVALAEVDAVVEEVRRPLSEAYHVGVRTHLLALDGLRVVAAALDGVTPWLVIKGPVLSGLLYSRADLRSYGDLDVLVPPHRLGAALGALEANGCVVADRNWDLLSHRRPGELHVMLPSGLCIDLHWHLRNSPALRAAFPADTEQLIDDGRDVVLSGIHVRTLGVADTFVHLALHACLAGGDRMQWAVDLREAVRSDRPRWGEVIAVAGRQRAGLAVGVMLRRADRALRLGVPEAVVDCLAPRAGWAMVTGLVDRVAPLEGTSRGPSASRIVLRSTRPTALASIAELMHRSTRWVAGGMRLDRRALDHDPASPTSLLHDAGGPLGRAAYLGLIADADPHVDGSMMRGQSSGDTSAMS